MKKVFVSDYTLKMLQEDREAGLLFRDKTAIAEGIDRFGADMIELPAVRNLREDEIIDRTIASVVTDAALSIPVGMSPESVGDAWQCVKDAKEPWLFVEVPVSTLRMEYLYHMKDVKMLSVVPALIEEAKKYTDRVEFVALDSSRAERDFLKEIVSAAAQAGAKAVTLCDDAGIFLPEDFAELVRDIRTVTDVPLYVRTSDLMRLGMANALAALSAGADGVKVCITGRLPLYADSFAETLRTAGERLGLTSGLVTEEIHHDIESLIRKVHYRELSRKKANLEAHDDTFLDRNTSREDLGKAVLSLGYDLSEEDLGNVWETLTGLFESKSTIGAKELEAVIAMNAMLAPSTYHLESYTVTTGNLSGAMACVVLNGNGESLSGTAVGEGPIDAAFKAIESAIGHQYELDGFEVNAVTEGKEALGATVVRLRNNGKLFSGNGLSQDIVGSSIRAYINALNKIVYEER